MLRFESHAFSVGAPPLPMSDSGLSRCWWANL